MEERYSTVANEETRSARMELGKLTRVGRSPAGLVNRADNRHCFGPSRSEPSSVTLPVTSMPRKKLLGPVNVPLSGRTCSGDQATATRIRLRFPAMLYVGSE